jgi:hypothetical protein
MSERDEKMKTRQKTRGVQAAPQRSAGAAAVVFIQIVFSRLRRGCIKTTSSVSEKKARATNRFPGKPFLRWSRRHQLPFLPSQRKKQGCIKTTFSSFNNTVRSGGKEYDEKHRQSLFAEFLGR